MVLEAAVNGRAPAGSYNDDQAMTETKTYTYLLRLPGSLKEAVERLTGRTEPVGVAQGKLRWDAIEAFSGPETPA